MKSVLVYFKGVGYEMSKVEWPKITDVIKFTIIVILVTGIVAAFVGVADVGFVKLLELIVS